MDLDAVRTFVTTAEAGRFQDAAADLAVTQQAVSKRIATLEKGLGVRLFTRTARGAKLTIDGQAFLPHARELLQAEARAVASVCPGRRALRVDVIGRRLAPAADLRRIPLRDPTPVYRHSLLWHHGNAHPALAALRQHLDSGRSGHSDAGTWTPTWAR
ncbi:LysR family transcriptional regulator [Streptomyces sp. NPDC021212]|uniref:LysR family transcriptional regulator n=1 Tax=Streptomyces sp. NPDC021212 TaxID=3365118 RepID=UPI0037A31595